MEKSENRQIMEETLARLVDELGVADAELVWGILAHELGGFTVYFPSIKQLAREKRDREIREAKGESACNLARRHGLSKRRVMDILNSPEGGSSDDVEAGGGEDFPPETRQLFLPINKQSNDNQGKRGN